MREQIIYIVDGHGKQGKTEQRAAFLYTPKAFTRALGYAMYQKFTHNAAHVLILDAKHGLIRPDELVSPHKEKVENMSVEARFLWEMKVRYQLEGLRQVQGTAERIRLVWLVDEARLPDLNRYRYQWVHELPLQNMTIRKRTRWLGEQTRVVPVSTENGQLMWDWEKAA
jgi:hypothetical protein